ncbi:hypothetical protein ASG11_00360 [Sphingomonas sp. Leaf357]|uniref:hypothetical protein n=1 Tax=Sphingomonas sp. Leaf357 TaxID=1736350 RepID=UPI0006F99C2A|nr:hypothetical protein [Sphingomonas sp. Leaf357]KQS02918.1 hypothetical protein ASG11_00360 [Sphingomonas sp. Leaf357]
MVRLPRRSLAALILPVALAACGGATPERNLDTLDAELTDGNASGNTRDPAMMAALQDQIMVDPALAAQANTDAVRPPARPYSGALPADGIAASGKTASATTGAATSETLKSTPAAKGDCPSCAAARESLTLGALASRQKGGGPCAASLRYSTHWAQRLPRDLPLYPDARVTEAAGNDSGGCAIRAVSFASSAPLQKVLDYYYTRASNAGYSAEHQADGGEHVLGGTRKRDDGAFAVFLTSRGDGGTDVDIVANRGI